MSNIASLTAESFETEVTQSAGKVVIDFWAPWCGPCKLVEPEIEKLAQKHANVRFFKLNVDEAPNIAMTYNVMGIPTVGVFTDGQLTATSVGAKPADAIERDLAL